jgi:hypothetical protein
MTTMGDVGDGPPTDGAPTEGPFTEGLSTSERIELERLRAEVARLNTRPRARAARAGRWTGSVALVVVAALLWAAAVVAVYVHAELLNTDRYVETVAPLARDPSVQDAITNRLTDEIMTQLDVQGLVQQLTTNLEQRGAPSALAGLVGPITGGVRSFVSSLISKVVTSSQFADVWDTANRVAHQEIDDVLTTGQGQFLTANGTQVSLNVGSLLTVVKQKLVDAGFSLAAKVPDTSIMVPLFEAKDLPRIRSAVKLLNTLVWVLPLIALVLVALAILVAPDHRRGLVLGAIAFGVMMLLMLAALAIVRSYYLDHLPNNPSPDAARVIYDTTVRFLVRALQTLTVLFGIVAFLAWVMGPSRPARLVRRGVDTVLDAGGHGLARTGVPLGPVPAFLTRWRKPIVGGVVILALVILWSVRTPGISGVVWATVGSLLLLALLEIIARASPPRSPVPSPA